MKFNDAVSQFGEYQKNILGRSENTIKSYKLDIEQFGRFLGLDGMETSKKDAERFVFWLVERNTAPSTRCRKIAAIQQFYEWAYDNALVEENPVKSLAKPKIPKKEVLAMTKEEVRKVIETAKGRAKSHQDYFRNLTMVGLMFSTGVRRNELVNIMVEDIDLNENSLFVREGKGDKQRIVYFNDSARALLCEWITVHRKSYETAAFSDYLFVTQRSGKMDVSVVNRVVNEIFEEAGLKESGFTAHSTRKSFATNVYGATKDIAVVQELLGHSSPTTTMRYIGINEENKRAAAKTLSF